MTIAHSLQLDRPLSVVPNPSTLAPYLAKLERRTRLGDEDRDAFMRLPMRVFVASANSKVYDEGGKALRCFFVLSGFLTRRKVAAGIGRIVGLSIPGDAADLQSLWFTETDHDLVAQGPVKLVAVAHEDLIELCAAYPSIAAVLWHDSLVDAAILREWTLNVGHRRARSRIGYFLLETAARLRAIGLCTDNSFELPLTQSELASALGLSLVQINKSLAALRQDGLLSIERRRITLLDVVALAEEVHFDDACLHIARPPKPAVRA